MDRLLQLSLRKAGGAVAGKKRQGDPIMIARDYHEVNEGIIGLK